jgi:hypothetical protein
VYIPDNMPAVGTCNAYPWGSASFTYVSRIPASFMDPANTLVDDIFFASCSSGTWSAAGVQIGLGHVPNPIANPFAFPQISGGTVMSLGGFQDLTVLWDSSIQGSFSWAHTSGAWAPLGFAAGGGTGFVWDGVNDVGFYVTMNGATGTSSMHRTGTEPFRLYVSGVYQAPSSTGSGPNGLKISFTLSPSGPEVIPYGAGCALSSGLTPTLGTNQIPSIGNPAFLVEISMADVGATTYVFLALGAGSTPLGGGCDLLLDLPSMLHLINIGFSPFGPALANGIGVATYPAPLPFDPGLSGARIWLQGAVLDTTPLGFAVTNGLEVGIF